MVILLFLTGSLFGRGIEVDTVENHIVKEFGNNLADEYILSLISDVDYYKGKLYITDANEHRIMVYDTLGNFVRQIGRQGQGPGEFYYPTALDIWKDTIVVLEEGNRRIQFFTLDGEYISSFHIKKHFFSQTILYRDSKVYLSTPDENHLISVYNNKGKNILTFGKPISPPPGKLYRVWNFGFVLKRGGKIYYLYESNPLLQIYTENGKLIKSINLRSRRNPFLEKRLKMQIKYLGNEKKEQPNLSYPLWAQAKLNPNGNLLIRDGCTIYVLDENNNIKRVVIQKEIGPKIFCGGHSNFGVDEKGRIWIVYSGGIAYLKP